MFRLRVAVGAAVVIALSACRVVSPASAPASPREMASAEASRPATPAGKPQASQCFLGGGVADVAYSDIRELARAADSIAVATVVRVGELQYTTESGERPSCEYIEAAGGVFAVGRMIELRQQRNVAGRSRGGGTFTYWLRGGTLGGDTSPPHPFGLETPDVGDRMLAFLMEEPGDIDMGPGVLRVDAYELFPIGRDGRIRTPRPEERVTTETVDAIVDEVVPAPSG